jgi:hypothetical protein
MGPLENNKRALSKGIRDSNGKIAAAVGLNAREHARRIRSLGKLAEGEGFELAVRSFGAW